MKSWHTPAPLSKNFLPRHVQFRGPCVVFEVLIDTPVNNAMGKFNLPMRTEPYRVVFVAERCGCGWSVMSGMIRTQ